MGIPHYFQTNPVDRAATFMEKSHSRLLLPDIIPIIQWFKMVWITMFYPRITHNLWLVVSTPLTNMKVSWDDYSQYMESHKIHVPNHQPDLNTFTIFFEGSSGPTHPPWFAAHPVFCAAAQFRIAHGAWLLIEIPMNGWQVVTAARSFGVFFGLI